MIIRPLENTDRISILKLESEVYEYLENPETIKKLGHLAPHFLVSYREHEIENLSDRSRFFHIGAFKDNKIIATAFFKKWHEDNHVINFVKSNGNKICLARHFCVKPLHYDEKIMTQLVTESINQLKDDGFDYMTAVAMPQNKPSIQIINKLGFEKIGEIPQKHVYGKEL